MYVLDFIDLTSALFSPEWSIAGLYRTIVDMFCVLVDCFDLESKDDEYAGEMDDPECEPEPTPPPPRIQIKPPTFFVEKSPEYRKVHDYNYEATQALATAKEILRARYENVENPLIDMKIVTSAFQPVLDNLNKAFDAIPNDNDSDASRWRLQLLSERINIKFAFLGDMVGASIDFDLLFATVEMNLALKDSFRISNCRIEQWRSIHFDVRISISKRVVDLGLNDSCVGVV